MKCSICSSALVKEVDELLGGGTSIRGVSRLTPFSRSTVARHRTHARPLGSRFGVIEGDAGSYGSLDPLGAAISLFRKATTERQRLRAAQGIRQATNLAVRQARGEVDTELLGRLDANIVTAAEMFRSMEGFDAELAALAGHREAVAERIRATQVVPGDTIEVGMPTIVFVGLNGERSEKPPPDDTPQKTYRVSTAAYWHGVPARFHDIDRYELRGAYTLSLAHPNGGEDLKVVERSTGAVVWARHTDPH